jgi:phosphoribosylamine--glycine ligase
MRVLIIGSGGREHALAWKLAQSPRLAGLYAAPGNPGIARHARCVPIRADAIDELARFASAEAIDLTVVGPEAPLVAGIADRFARAGLRIFGPTAAAAAIEGSKAFAKDLMARHGIPTARFRAFTDGDAARAFCRGLGAPLVVKADGLAAGKGAIVCASLDEADEAVATCLERRSFGDAGSPVVIEEFMAGEEASVFALSNGEEAVAFGVAQDHKRVYDDDRGPNTGGMGAYSPAPTVDGEVLDTVMETIVRPTVRALAKEGRAYRGVLYAGLMLTPEGPKVLEFNCRFGDPECQVLLTRLDDDLLPWLDGVARGAALAASPRWRAEASVCVVAASGGYPGEYRTGVPITGVEEAEALPGVVAFHSGTAIRAANAGATAADGPTGTVSPDGVLVTAGGRVLGVTATGASLGVAIDTAYRALARIGFEGMHFRRDIGRRARPISSA